MFLSPHTRNPSAGLGRRQNRSDGEPHLASIAGPSGCPALPTATSLDLCAAWYLYSSVEAASEAEATGDPAARAATEARPFRSTKNYPIKDIPSVRWIPLPGKAEVGKP